MQCHTHTLRRKRRRKTTATWTDLMCASPRFLSALEHPLGRNPPGIVSERMEDQYVATAVVQQGEENSEAHPPTPDDHLRDVQQAKNERRNSGEVYRPEYLFLSDSEQDNRSSGSNAEKDTEEHVLLPTSPTEEPEDRSLFHEVRRKSFLIYSWTNLLGVVAVCGSVR
ncbi:hypothetical protein BWQ96_08695 [Gracilariopsis chorda]|uniref:Uncharacterized protein n=1 Tax=Gracilariopsis chorda TaxID=448386 RepID=A0A2V3IHN9_9FLOR|nr:hypothetical protein BWQ96_08695 [Gracilariopsis chorda]|eukprot:PXF41581.1 hypothetical protein BWQ96_08695 [Gracilariopsis chorda]